MDTLIDLYAKFTGLWAKIADLLPLLGALGGILGAGATIAARAAQSKDAATLLHSLHPTTEEMAAISLSIGLIKTHFNHQENKAMLDMHHELIGPLRPS